MRQRKETEYIRSLIRRDSPVQLNVEHVPGEISHTFTKCPMCGHIFRIVYDGGVVVAGCVPKFCEDCGQRIKND